MLSATCLGPYLQGILYTFDDAYFPRRGISLKLRGDYDFLRPGASDFSPVLTAGMDLRAAIPLGGNWTLLPDVHLRAISHFGEEAVDGLIHTNFIGGGLAERFADDQMPFFGINTLLAAGDYLVNSVLELRWRALGNLYFSALAGAVSHDNSLGDLFRNIRPDTWALGLEGAYDTFAGPVKLNLHWSNIQGWGAYVSLGFDF